MTCWPWRSDLAPPYGADVAARAEGVTLEEIIDALAARIG